ncbi:MAG: phenylalanine--tRNA ligase subunit beta [Desulfobacteraceae bacterium]|nr:phenylalanine--tRNA ligase subunit beta [Desulfobacteraceae bacterium]
MRILTSWLREFVSFDTSVEQLAEDLTLGGFEIEAVEPCGKDFVLDISITPNRPDCLSVLGIAREVAAIYGLPLTDPFDESGASGFVRQGAAGLGIAIEAPESCPRYTAAILDGVNIGPSPDWLKVRLEAGGIRPINNVVDVTNYVLLERGQPLHAFDLDRLNGPRVIVRNARQAESLVTIDGRQRHLASEMLVIADEDGPVAVAGVIGGEDTEVGAHTRRILLESAYFIPSQVRRTAKALKISTEASYRFERGTDPQGVISALKRAAVLILDIAGARSAEFKDVYPCPAGGRTIGLRPARVERLLGVAIGGAHIVAMLKTLGLLLEREAEGCLYFSIPSYRHDLVEEADLIEEVARLYGYGNIASTIPEAGIAVDIEGYRQPPHDRARRILVSQGMSEIISYSFLSDKEISRLGLNVSDPRSSMVRLKNPLSEDLAVMRTSLLPQLFGAVARNQSQRNMDQRLFEIGAVFLGKGAGLLPDEECRVAAVLSGARNQASWAWSVEPVDVFDIKGVMEELLKGFFINRWTLEPGTPGDPFYLSGASARIVDAGGAGELGTFGEVAPDILAEWGIEGRLFAFDLSVDRLDKAASSRPQFMPLPRFPAVERDVALIISDSIPARDVLDFVRGCGPEFLEDVEIFDVYAGSPIPKGSKSLGLRLRYRAAERTLSEEEVSGPHDGLVGLALKRFDASLRG